jgi:hypothetical protein
MAIRQDDNKPNRRLGIINLVLIGFGVLLLFSSFLPNQQAQVPRVPYSLFINQVDDGAVKRAYITQDQIRYELSNPGEGEAPVLATTPIFDMELPKRLEAKGVEFAAAPPKRPSFFTTLLSRSVSAAMRSPNALGVPPTMFAPNLVRRCRTSRSARALANSALSRSTMATGVGWRSWVSCLLVAGRWPSLGRRLGSRRGHSFCFG